MKTFCRIVKNVSVLNLAFYTLIILSVFDQTREALPLPYIVMKFYAYLRDFLILSLFFHFLMKQKKHIPINYVFGLTVLLILLSIPISYLTGNGIGLPVKFAWLQIKHFLIYYILICYISSKNIDYILRFLLKLGIVFFIFNIIFIIFFSSILTRLLSGGLRLTVGNSSTISFLYFALFLVSINFKLFKNKIIAFLYSLIFFIAILTTVTTTALVALIPVILVKYLELPINRKINFIIIASIITTIFIINFTSKAYSEKNFASYLYEKSGEVIELIFSKNKMNVGTLSIREYQRKIVQENMKTEDYFIGLGSGGYQKYCSNLENFYYVLLYDYGILSLIIFVLLLLKYFIISFINGHYFFVQIIIILASYCYTLDFFLPYITGFSFVLLLAIGSVKHA